MMKARLTAMAKRSALVDAGGRALARVVPASGRRCPVVTFHRIETYRPEFYPGLASLDGDEFAEFADELADRFHPIDIDEFESGLTGRRPFRPDAVLVTFDDAYRDFADIAWPVLRDRGIPVLLFVPTSYPGQIDRTFWWDEVYAAIASSDAGRWSNAGLSGSTPDEAFRSIRERIKSLPHDDAMATVDDLVLGLADDEATATTDVDATHPASRVLGWDELNALRDDGVALAPHSRTHPMLDQLDEVRLDEEVAGSLDDLREQIGPDRVHPVFAYPAGGHDAGVRDAVRRAGYSMAFTTERGLVDATTSDPFRLPRLNVGRRSTAGFIAAEVAVRGAVDAARSATRVRHG